MNAKVIQAIEFLNSCSTKMLKEKLKDNPASYAICFNKNSQEYKELINALKTNRSLSWRRKNAIYLPTAIKLVNLF